MRKHEKIEDGFWEKVTKTPDCWVWHGSQNKQGYGNFWYSGKCLKAHRASWMMAYGEIPSGLDVLHKCDNPACVRPEHLFLGTDVDNANDRSRKGRSKPRKGETNGNAKLTEQDVAEIRSIGGNRHALAKKYGVSDSLISHVINRRIWRHVP